MKSETRIKSYAVIAILFAMVLLGLTVARQTRGCSLSNYFADTKSVKTQWAKDGAQLGGSRMRVRDGAQLGQQRA